MKTAPTAPIAAALLALFAVQEPTHAADDVTMLRLATCQDSWLEWKNDEPRMARFASLFETQFVRSEQGDAFAPRAPTSVLGYAVAQVYPQSVGMGLGYSVLVNAPFAQVRQSFEKQLGKPLKCSTSEGTRACELPLAAKKTAMLLASDNPNSKTTLLGCYYYYQQ